MGNKIVQMQPLDSHRSSPCSSNLPLVDERTATAEVRALFARYRDCFGRSELPGIVLCFAANPALLQGMMEIAEHLLFGETLLSRRCKEMIATYISRENRCAYCADSHAALLAAEGGSSELICALEEGALDDEALSPAELALLQFAGQVNANSPAVVRADVEAVMRAGWTEAQVTEAVHITSLFAAFNRVANGFGLASPYPGGVRGHI